MTSETVLSSLTVEGYLFYRSDGKLFDSSVMTFVPPYNSTRGIVKPQAKMIIPAKYNGGESYMEDEYYHMCTDFESVESFTLANRCEPSWSALSDQQKNAVEKIEEQVTACRHQKKFFSSVILEGLGGCGKTRLMAYVMNHSPASTHVIYLTKQNKRLQDFLYDEIGQGELIRPQPVTDLTKSLAGDFDTLCYDGSGRYACTVEKLVYNASDFRAARQTNSRKALQWKMHIPDVIFGKDLAERTGNTVVLLDEYTMISPPLLHKMLHCVRILFDAPTVLIMGGDQFQLGPINWDAESDKSFRGRCGVDAPAGAITTNNEYYVSDVREELVKRLGEPPFEYKMTGSQRCRDDPELAKMVLYLRNSCEKRTSVKAIERRLVAFGRARGIRLYRYEVHRNGSKTGQLIFKEDDDLGYDTDDDDRHLGDDDSRDTIDIEIDWTKPPAVDMSPFIEFYRTLYEDIYLKYQNGSLNDERLPRFVYDKASRFTLANFPIFLVKKNDKCNILSDTFLKTLYNGVYTELRNKYSEDDIKPLLEKLCVSMAMAGQGPVQQTLMTGVPYRVTETLKSWNSAPVVSNGELVLLAGVKFDETRSVKCVILKTLQRDTDYFLSVKPGFTQNRLVETVTDRISDSFSLFSAINDEHIDSDVGVKRRKKEEEGTSTTAVAVAFMLPLVPMVCENIYQMQGNTIISDCFIDLLSTKQNDIYVAVSRFRKTSSVKGIILSK